MTVDFVHIAIAVASAAASWYAARQQPDGGGTGPAPRPAPGDPRLAALLELGKQILRDEDHDGVADVFQRGLLRRKPQSASPAVTPGKE